MRRSLVVLLAGLVLGLNLLGACGGGASRKASPPVIAGTWTAPAMLGHVPADSPYVFGVIDPLPAPVRDLMFATADKRMAEAMKALEDIPAGFDRSTLPGYIRALLVVFDELRGKDLAHWGTELGFDPSGRFMFYGLSLWPVIRVSVGDAAKMRRIAKRMLAASGARVDEGATGGRAYWRVDEKGMTVIAAVLTDEAVASVFPTSIASAMIPLVLGTESPPRTLRETNTIADIASHYQLMPAMVGYVDVRGASNILTRRVPSALPALDKPITDAAGPVTSACAAEVDRLVALAPRLILGYRKLDTNGMHARFIAEASPAVVHALARLRVAVPEVTPGLSPARPIGSLGIAANIDELIPLVRSVAREVDQHPFQCSWFAGLNRVAASVLPAVSKPLPPALMGLRGASVVFEDLVKDPLDVTGHIVIDGAHAAEALHLLLTFVPGLGTVSVPPSRTPVALPLGMYGVPPGISVHAAATTERVGIAVGPDSPARAVGLLDLGVPQRSPLLSFGMDAVRAREIGWLDAKEDRNMMEVRDVAMQLDVISEGLVVDMFATFPH